MDGRRFALPSGDVTELAPPVRLHRFPHATPLLEGVIVRRGHIVPVYDISSLVGRRPLLHRFYLVSRLGTGSPAKFAAIPVSGECELVTCELEPAASQPAYISGTVAIDGQSIQVLDLDKLVTPAVAHEEAPS